MTDQPPSDAAPLLLTVPRAVAYSGIPRTRLFALQQSGQLPGVLIGGRRYWRRDDIDAFVLTLSGAA